MQGFHIRVPFVLCPVTCHPNLAVKTTDLLCSWVPQVRSSYWGSAMVTCLCFMTSGPSAGKTQVTSGGTDSRGLLSPGCDGSRLQARLSWRCQLGCRSAWTLRPAWPLSMVADRSRELGRSDKAISDPAVRATLVSSMLLRQLRFKGREVRVHLPWGSNTVP